MFHVIRVIQHAKRVEMQTTVKLVCQRLLLLKMEFAYKKIHVLHFLPTTRLLLAIACLVLIIVRFVNQLINAKFA